LVSLGLLDRVLLQNLWEKIQQMDRAY